MLITPYPPPIVVRICPHWKVLTLDEKYPHPDGSNDFWLVNLICVGNSPLLLCCNHANNMKAFLWVDTDWKIWINYQHMKANECKGFNTLKITCLVCFWTVVFVCWRGRGEYGMGENMGWGWTVLIFHLLFRDSGWVQATIHVAPFMPFIMFYYKKGNTLLSKEVIPLGGGCPFNWEGLPLWEGRGSGDLLDVKMV